MIKVLDNVYDLVTLNMEQRFSERVALRFYDKETDEVTAVHYKDYARDIRRAVSYFQSTIPDIKGKKICLLNKNSYEYAVNTFGIILAGGVLVLLNQHKSWDELSYELGLVDPAAILTDGDDYGTKEQLQAAYGSILRPMDGFRAYEPVAEMPRCIGHDDLMILMFTSGTTGRSKGVMLSERNMCASLHTYSEVAENWIRPEAAAEPYDPAAPLPHGLLRLRYVLPACRMGSEPLRRHPRLLPRPGPDAQRRHGLGPHAGGDHLQ